jgi:hypothetical protein
MSRLAGKGFALGEKMTCNVRCQGTFMHMMHVSLQCRNRTHPLPTVDTFEVFGSLVRNQHVFILEFPFTKPSMNIVSIISGRTKVYPTYQHQKTASISVSSVRFFFLPIQPTLRGLYRKEGWIVTCSCLTLHPMVAIL